MKRFHIALVLCALALIGGFQVHARQAQRATSNEQTARKFVPVTDAMLAKPDPRTGEPAKMSFGPWMLGMFKVLAKLKGLRGTALDIFGRTEERRTERKLIADYQAMLKEVLDKLNVDNHALAVGLLSIPEKIRGYGPVKTRHLKAAKADEAALLEQFRSGPAPLLKAAE